MRSEYDKVIDKVKIEKDSDYRIARNNNDIKYDIEVENNKSQEYREEIKN